MGEEWMWLWNTGRMITNRQTEEVVENLVSVMIWQPKIPHGLLWIDSTHLESESDHKRLSIDLGSFNVDCVLKKVVLEGGVDYLLCDQFI